MIDFESPQQLIAQQPASPRDSARLLVYDRATQKITDTVFSDLITYITDNTTLVVNNSKVEQCRWLFDDRRTEIFVLEKLDPQRVRVMVRPGRKFKLDKTVQLTPWLTVTTTAIDDDGFRTLELSVPHDDERLKEFEHVPLPPYIAQNDELADEYQTVYAKPLGSIAAPIAGLHFTDGLLQEVSAHHNILEVTLHVGLGTFAPLTEALCGDTDIFIQPGYEFKRVDSLITNFHLPGTSLLLMIEAFVGSESEAQRIYNHAIAQNYRFYSFGDAMLIV